MEDVIFYITILYNIKNIYIENKPLYFYSQNEEGATRSKDKIVKNLKSLKMYNTEVKKELRKTGFYSEDRIKMIDTRCTESVSDLLSLMNYDKNLNKKEKIQIFKEFFESKENLEFITNCDKTKLPNYKLMTISLGINRKYNLLYFYIQFRKICSHIKKMIKRG